MCIIFIIHNNDLVRTGEIIQYSTTSNILNNTNYVIVLVRLRCGTQTHTLGSDPPGKSPH